MRPTARLPANISLSARAFANTFAPPATAIIPQKSNRHCPQQRALVEGFAGAGIDNGAALHDGEMVAEFAGKVEILFDQHDSDLAKRAQVADGAADVLD